MNHSGMMYSDTLDQMINLSDTTKYPSIPVGNLEDIFGLEDISNLEYRKKNFDTYFFNGIPVPRVTHILDIIGNKDGIVNWAASFNNFKKFKAVQQATLECGTLAHDAIEAYLLNPDAEEEILFSMPPNSVGASASNAFKSFINWKRKLELQGYYIERVLATEQPMICPYFGGKFDAVITINGADYIVDFKTSKRLQPYNLIQVCTYFWMINNGYCESVKHVHGVGLIRVDKNDPAQNNDYFLNSFNPQQNDIIQSSINAFGAYCNAYYYYLNQDRNYASGRKLNANLYNVLGDE